MADAKARYWRERENVFALYEEAGLQLPPNFSELRETTQGAMVRSTLAHAFAPTETRQVHTFGAYEDEVQHFITEVQPRVLQGIDDREPAFLALGEAVGGLLAAESEQAFPFVRFHPPFSIENGELHISGQTQPINFDQGLVVEFGMGLNGLAAHVPRLKEGAYVVVALSQNAGEAALLDGMAEYFGVGGQVANLEVGIEKGIDRLLPQNPKAPFESPFYRGVDLVVATHVHFAGEALRYGLNRAPELLRDDGLLVTHLPSDLSTAPIDHTRLADILGQPDLSPCSQNATTTRGGVSFTTGIYQK